MESIDILLQKKLAMFSFFGLIFGDRYWRFKSYFIKLILISKGIKVGKNFYIMGNIYLKIKGKASNIIIGNNVSILGNIDLRNRENGRIFIQNNIKFDTDCRLVSANNATLIISNNCTIGPRCIFNCGADVLLGENVLFAGAVYLNSSDHQIAKKYPIVNQGFFHGKIIIENDVFVGANTMINQKVTLSTGSVIGSNSVVTKNTEPYSINVGSPNKKIGERR